MIRVISQGSKSPEETTFRQDNIATSIRVISRGFIREGGRYCSMSMAVLNFAKLLPSSKPNSTVTCVWRDGMFGDGVWKVLIKGVRVEEV